MARRRSNRPRTPGRFPCPLSQSMNLFHSLSERYSSPQMLIACSNTLQREREKEGRTISLWQVQPAQQPAHWHTERRVHSTCRQKLHGYSMQHLPDTNQQPSSCTGLWTLPLLLGQCTHRHVTCTHAHTAAIDRRPDGMYTYTHTHPLVFSSAVSDPFTHCMVKLM